MAISMRRCGKCQEVKQYTKKFFKPRAKDIKGLRSTCRVCDNEYQKQYYRMKKGESHSFTQAKSVDEKVRFSTVFIPECVSRFPMSIIEQMFTRLA